MKILFHIGHPAHVHLFKNVINILKEKKHQIKIIARDKDVTLKLLQSYGFEYEIISKRSSQNTNKLFEGIKKIHKVYEIARKNQSDLLIEVGGTYSSIAGKLLGKRSIAFTDTEHAKLANALAFPFATVIITPSCFKKDLGKKQIRYNGFHELAYLHPSYFIPDQSVLKNLNLAPSERFFILRFVAWDAVHDRGQSGINAGMRKRLVYELKKFGKVLITSENELPEDFEPYKIKIGPEKMHDLLYYSSLYIGDGATMATEAGILGTPSIYISSLVGTMGNFEELEKKYGLVFSFQDANLALEKAIEFARQPSSKVEWKEKRDKLFYDNVDVTAFMVKFIENF